MSAPGSDPFGRLLEMQAGASARADYAQSQAAMVEATKNRVRQEDLGHLTQTNLHLLRGLVEVEADLNISDLADEAAGKFAQIDGLHNLRAYYQPFSWMAHPPAMVANPEGPAGPDGVRVIRGWNLRWYKPGVNFSRSFRQPLPNMAILLFQEVRDDVPQAPRLAAPLQQLPPPRVAEIGDFLARDSSLTLKYAELSDAAKRLTELTIGELAVLSAELLLLADRSYEKLPNYEHQAYASWLDKRVHGFARIYDKESEALGREAAAHDIAKWLERLKERQLFPPGTEDVLYDPDVLVGVAEGVPGPIYESSAYCLRAIRAYFALPSHRHNRIGRKVATPGGVIGGQSWVAEPVATNAETDRQRLRTQIVANYEPYLQRLIRGERGDHRFTVPALLADRVGETWQ